MWSWLLQLLLLLVRTEHAHYHLLHALFPAMPYQALKEHVEHGRTPDAEHKLEQSLPPLLQSDALAVAVPVDRYPCAGFAGLSSYCPTKYAVRGLADTLRNEVQLVCH